MHSPIATRPPAQPVGYHVQHEVVPLTVGIIIAGVVVLGVIVVVIVLRSRGRTNVTLGVGPSGVSGSVSNTGAGAHISKAESAEGAITAHDRTGGAATISDAKARGDIRAEVSPSQIKKT